MLDLLRMEWNIDKAGQALSDFSNLESDEFVREVKNRRTKGSPRLTSLALAELRQLLRGRGPVGDRQARPHPHPRA